MPLRTGLPVSLIKHGPGLGEPSDTPALFPAAIRGDGSLVGITSSNQQQTGAQNITYAIPSNYIFGVNVWEAPSVGTP